MLTPAHHIDDATLASYSAGSLPMPLGVVVATHMRLCPLCRARLAEADAVGGTLVRQQEPAPLSADARATILARLDAEPVPLGHADPTDEAAADAAPAAYDGDRLPPELHAFFGDSYSGLRWKRVVPGVQRIRVRTAGAGDLMLLRIAPGKSMPMHSHQGSEMTVVLKGAYRDALGRFGPGDMADLDSEVMHQPVTEAGEACICLAATDAPLRFPGRVARMLQPLLGF